MMDGRFTPGDLVSARGREWLVLPSPSQELLHIRPLSGSDEDAIRIDPSLELAPVKPAHFPAPTIETLDTQNSARLLSDAIRLSLRRGAGPFRSAAHLGVEPRAYQLVPLMMALKLDPIRLLIADDVGIGKTIEAGMIIREMFDRGQIDRFTVLCPPHLVTQWVSELNEKFDLDAVAVTASKARGLERDLPASQSLFEAYPFTVVSLDYIKAERRRAEFIRACPDFVIVDEAHTCVGGGQGGRHQRYEVLRRLSEDETRHLLLLTATPHSGDEDAFDRLLGLIDPLFKGGPPLTGDENARERYARRLAQHFVQRRRADIEDGGWLEQRTFPKHFETDVTYTLTGAHAEFQESVLDYCLAVTQRVGSDERRRRLAFWGTLALMRCVGSSPAAAVSALRNRLAGLAEEDLIEPAVFDEEDGLIDDGDLEPATAIDEEAQDEDLARLIALAEGLEADFEKDPKIKALINTLKPLLSEDNANPVVFCRFIATAKAVGAVLEKVFKKTHEIIVVTGELTADERKARVERSESAENRILVATDCLSEGINLQYLFDSVIHYDLSWNPTRHQQREGRVDRFGQKAERVWSATLFGENSAIDGAVLSVILRKAKRIREKTGISVPMPEDNDSVSRALMQAMLLRAGGNRSQGIFDFGDAEVRLEAEWRDAEENAKASRARYAQRALKPEEVIPEWRSMRALNGGPEEVERFVRRSARRVGAPLGNKKEVSEIYLDEFPLTLREKLESRGFVGTRRIRFDDELHLKQMHVGRVHPIVSTLAETLSESALDPQTSDLTSPLGRAGVWKTNHVGVMTTVLLLRLRFKLVTSGRTKSLLLAEEATGLAFPALSAGASYSGADALALLEAEATEKIEGRVRERRFSEALERLESYGESIAKFAHGRAAALSEDHLRLTGASRGGATVQVEPNLPSDILGLYVLLPEAT
jgi:superfamily II DNA or RNA helicase